MWQSLFPYEGIKGSTTPAQESLVCSSLTISVTMPSRTDNETAMSVSHLLLFEMPDWCLCWPCFACFR